MTELLTEIEKGSYLTALLPRIEGDSCTTALNGGESK
jgi:hypothetical protein